MPVAVTLSAVGKRFGGAEVLHGVDLAVAPGEFVALLGASGCGKSTLLRLVAGLEAPTAGEVRLDGRPVAGVDPRCAVVFQEPRLLPWRTVAGNVALGARRGGGALSQEEILRRVGLSGHAKAWPHQLSGGMAQRAALARALAGAPGVLLLDEPFAALDALTRLRMQDLLIDACGDPAPTVLMVTHDVDEAIRLAHRVVVLGGRPAGVRAVYRTPARDDAAAVDALRTEILGLFGLGGDRVHAHHPRAPEVAIA
jgi:sulfonate transport system ATP-binding protein